MDESRTRALLAEIAADPEPCTRVDVDQIMATGRRPRYRIALAAAAVVVAVVAIVALVRPDTEAPAPVVNAPSPVTAPSELTAPTRFDPLRTRIAPGWLPDGFVADVRTSGAVGQDLVAWSDKSSGEVGIYLSARNAAPRRLGGGNGTPEPGPDINGAPSTWEAGENAGLLRWEWAPGAPALVRVLDLQDARGVAARVAAALELGAEHPVALPFTVSTPPGLSVTGASFEKVQGRTESRLTFDGDGGATHAVSVRVFSKSTEDSVDATTTVNGTPTQVRATSLETSVIQRSGDDLLEVHCQTRTGHPIDAVRSACLRVMETTLPVGTLDDPSTWTTAPVT